MLANASGTSMDLNLEQISDDGAFFATRSSVEGKEANSVRVQRKSTGLTEVEVLEHRIEKDYLSSSTECIGDGVQSGFDSLSVKHGGLNKQYRLQCYRSR